MTCIGTCNTLLGMLVYLSAFVLTGGSISQMCTTINGSSTCIDNSFRECSNCTGKPQFWIQIISELISGL